jgi:hypothetical protein
MRGAQCCERAVEVCGAPGPQGPGRREVVVGACAALAGGYADSIELARVPAGADAQDQAPPDTTSRVATWLTSTTAG